jgi:roadblock/LC7 domain-containing protein
MECESSVEQFLDFTDCSRFLWAKYLIKMIWEDCTGEDSTDESVYKTLKKLPKDLNETYERCLAKVNRDSKRKSLADRVLKWICVSLEPFKLTQLQEALAVNPDTGELGESLIHKEEIMTCCASLAFLEDDSDELVLLAHHSVRQFLFPTWAESAYSTAQAELGELCVIYLYRHRPAKQLVSHPESTKFIETLPIPRSFASTIGSAVAPGIFKSFLSTRSSQSVPIQVPNIASRNAATAKQTEFLSYAKRNWILLTPNLPPTSRHWTAFKNLALPKDRSWDIYPWPQHGYQSLDSHVFQLYGWSIINSHYALLSLAIGQQGNVKSDIFNLPLFHHGSEAIMPLPAAATVGDTNIVASLVKIMPKVNEQYSYALHAASSKGRLEVVQLLLKAGTNVNAKSPNSALQAACGPGHDRVVQCLLDAGADLNVGTLEGHLAVAFSPDGQLVASGLSDKTVRLWDAKTGAVRRTLKGHTNRVTAVAFSPDGQLVASASTDKTVRLWDAKTGAAWRTLKGHTSEVRAMAFSPDGQLVASASTDKTVRLWDAKIGAAQRTLEGHTDWVMAVVFSPDGQLVASASVDKTVKLWVAKLGAAQRTLKGHTSEVHSVAFSPDGQLVASASADKTVRLWDAKTGAARYTLEGHTGIVEAVVFSPDGQLVASASVDKTVKLWDVKTGAVKRTLEGHTDWVMAVAFSPNGQLVASASLDRTVRLWVTLRF